MICDDVRKYDYTYLDGEFDRRERAEFEAHILSCASCRSHVESAARFRDGLRRHLRCDEAPNHLRAQICAELNASISDERMPTWVLPMAIAAGVSVIMVGWQYTGERTSSLPNNTMAARVVAGAPPRGPRAAPVRLVRTATKVAGAIGVRGSDPKIVRRHKPAMRVTRSLSNDREYCESERRAAGALRVVEHMRPTEVIGGGVGNDFLARGGRYGAIRTRSNLRSLVGSHMQPVPPEVAGSARVQVWLRSVAPGHSALPIAEGAGVQLLGARLGHLGSRRVVTFRYVAFDKAVTVVRYLPASGHGLVDDRPEPAPANDERQQRSGAVRDIVAGYSVVHTVKGGEILSVVSELEHKALIGIIEPPSFL